MRQIWPNRLQSDRRAWEALLEAGGIRGERPIDASFGLYDGDRLIATASLFQNIIKCVAVDPAYQGGSVFNELISGMLNELYRRGFQNAYVYTKPSAQKAFGYLGFKLIESVGSDLCFMEQAAHGLNEFLSALAGCRQPAARVASIVMNANPFTLGHRHLVEAAMSQADVLHLFVVSEDCSAFPTEVRRALVHAGVADLSGIIIHETGPYLVSSATFPSYFLKASDDVTRIQATLDAKIFKRYFVPTLGITHRFVGEEPFSPATAAYNAAMAAVFDDAPDPGVPKLQIMPRKLQCGEAISASNVRRFIAIGDLDAACALVPETTAAFLRSEAAAPVIATLAEDPDQGRKGSDIGAQ